MTAPSTQSTPDVPSNRPVPPLEKGDRLTRAEFERRYEAMPYLKKAELIEGVVYVPSPFRILRHGNPHANLVTWIGVYAAGTPGVVNGDNTTTRLDLDNEPQPDALLFIAPARGGQVRITQDDYIEGGPELVAEVAASRVSYDVNVKLNVYRRNGVREYIVWRVLDQELDWYVLRAGQYELVQPDQLVRLRSKAFPGLWLDVAALLRGDIAAVLGVVQEGMRRREHAEFAAKLAPPAP
jgi:hypothetical protein